MKRLRKTIVSRAERFLRDWAVPRQLAGEDMFSTASKSSLSNDLRPRLEEADTIGTSICPFCAVGCAQLVYAKNRKPIHIEGDPRSPVNRGCLCPKGGATLGMLLSPKRVNQTLYRAPNSDTWEVKPLEWAMDRIAELTKKARDETHVHALPDGRVVNQTTAISHLGGATMDNEENYLIKKLFSGGLGMVNIENQARI